LKLSLTRLLATAARLSDGRFTVLAACSIIATSAVVGTAYGSSIDPGLANALARLFADAGSPGASDTAASGQTPLPSIPAPPPSSPAAPRPAPAPANTVTTASQPPPASTTPPQTQTTPPPAPPPTTPPLPTTPVKHVFLISLASPGYDAAFGDEANGVAAEMPYLADKLRPKGELLTDYSLLEPTDLANYIAMTSGQPPNPDTKAGCPKYSEFKGGTAPNSKGIVPGTGCVYPNTALTVGDQLTAGGYTWSAYIEGMGDANGPGNCIHPDSGAPDQTIANSPDGLYTDRHNPWVYYHSLLDLGSCFNDDVPGDQLATDLKKEATTPNLSFISPGLCNSGAADPCPDGSPGGAATEDAYLAALVPEIMKSPAYRKDGMIIITFGERGPAATSKGAVGTLVVSQFVAPGGTLVEPYDPYSLAASLEDFFGLTHLAMADDPTTSSFATSVLGAGD
jgi:hypothetical protein